MRLSAQTPCWRTHAVLPSEGRWALASAERTFTRADAFAVQLVRDLERCAAPVSIPAGPLRDPLTKVGHRFLHLTGTIQDSPLENGDCRP